MGLDSMIESEICSACNGSGEGSYDGSSCFVCRGRGEVPAEEIDHEETIDFVPDSYLLATCRER